MNTPPAPSDAPPDARIAVVIPVKGRTDLLRDAVDSIRSQSLVDWEAIMVDDGSTHEELDAISGMIGNDRRLRLVRRDRQPAGANHCRNLGIQQTHSDLLVFLDSDDLLSADSLEARVAAMRSHLDSAFVVFGHENFTEKPGDMAAWPLLAGEDHLDRFLRMDVPWQTAGPTWRRSALNKLGPWDQGLACWQDWDFHVRALCLELPYSVIPTPKLFHRVPGLHRECISFSTPSRVRTASQEKVINGSCSLLLRTSRLTPARKLLLARLLLTTSERWLEVGDSEAAMRCWKTTFDFNLIPSRVYREGVALLRVHKSVFFRKSMRLYTHFAWPPSLRHVVEV